MQDNQRCFHCDLPADDQFSAEVLGQQRAFCCLGCQAVAMTIASNGLGNFYKFRDESSQRPSAKPSDFEIFDSQDIQSDFIFDFENQKLAKLHIKGITCAACVWLLEQHLQRLDGIAKVSVNASSHQANIVFDSSLLKVSEIFRHIAQLGFQAAPLLAQEKREHWKKQRKEDLLRLGVAGIAMMQAGMTAVGLHAGDMQGIDPQWQSLLRWVSFILVTPVIFYSAVPFYKASIRAIKMRSLVMDVPVSIALLLAYFSSLYATVSGGGQVYFDSVSMFAFFLLLGRYLEKGARYKNLQATADRAQLKPVSVTIKTEEGNCVIPLKRLKVDDFVVVGSGEAFPCDGVVIQGESEVDESLMTGEAEPIKKSSGDTVLSGSYNGNTELLIKATAVGGDTQLAAIENLMAQAELEKPKQVQLADKIAARFVGFVLLVASTVFFTWYWIDSDKALWVTLSVLVVTCPCALSLAAPTAITTATNYLRSLGVLITGESVLETVPKISCVAFDKTGTLTEGRLKISKVELLGQYSVDQVLLIASALEAGSRHPIARAFDSLATVYEARNRATQVGRGVSAWVNGVNYRLGVPDFAFPKEKYEYPSVGQWVLLADENNAIAWILLEDELRSTAIEAVNSLRQKIKNLSILSGDRKENVESLASVLGIRHAYHKLLPSDKLERLRTLQERGETVMMVGDGINDLPVLAAADVSIAMGCATDLTHTKAQVILLSDDLNALPRLIAVAQKTKRIMRQNFSWAIAYNLIALPAAAAGAIQPWLAAIGMSLSSLVVVLNALRLQKQHRK